MTTMAALLGGVPLMLGQGSGSELRQPLGYAMVGGLALSQMLTLFMTPVIYLYLDRLQERLGAGFRRSAQEDARGRVSRSREQAPPSRMPARQGSRKSDAGAVRIRRHRLWQHLSVPPR